MEQAYPQSGSSDAIWWTDDDRLALGRCSDCERLHHYPRPFCPHCHSTKVGLTGAQGTGTIYSVTHTLRSAQGPFLLALVELSEGLRLMTHIVADDPASVAIGNKVQLIDRSETSDAPRFRLAG